MTDANANCSGWMPIESAPDHCNIVLWPDEYGKAVVPDKLGGGVFFSGDWDYAIPATHWMPLPPPPSERAG